MLSLLSFHIGKWREPGGVIVITPHIDGRALPDIVEEFERSRGLTDPAGGYGGLIPSFFSFGALDQYFLGRSGFVDLDDRAGRLFVLGCECGEVGCWPLQCAVRVTDGTVSWFDFAQPHRPGRDYSAFGPFVFERQQYEDALRGLNSAPVD